jgi:hypothetical protein
MRGRWRELPFWARVPLIAWAVFVAAFAVIFVVGLALR